MLDGFRWEGTGNPAVIVATTSFVRLATSIKRSMNLEDLPLVVLSHPLGAPSVAAAKAQSVAEEIVNALTG